MDDKGALYRGLPKACKVVNLNKMNSYEPGVALNQMQNQH